MHAIDTRNLSRMNLYTVCLYVCMHMCVCSAQQVPGNCAKDKLEGLSLGQLPWQQYKEEETAGEFPHREGKVGGQDNQTDKWETGPQRTITCLLAAYIIQVNMYIKICTCIYLLC